MHPPGAYFFLFPPFSFFPSYPFSLSHTLPLSPLFPLLSSPLSVRSLPPFLCPLSSVRSPIRPLAVCPFPLPPCFPLFPLLTQTKRAKYDSNRQPLTKSDKKRRINKKRGKGEKKTFTMR